MRDCITCGWNWYVIVGKVHQCVGAGVSVSASDRVMSQYLLYKSARVVVWEYVQDQHWQLLADSCGASHVLV